MPITLFEILLIFSSFHKPSWVEPYIHSSLSHACLANLVSHFDYFNEFRGRHLHHLLIPTEALCPEIVSFYNNCGQSQPALLPGYIGSSPSPFSCEHSVIVGNYSSVTPSFSKYFDVRNRNFC